MRRAPAKAQEGFKGDALQALDLRTAAEVLLLFYQDLAGRGQAEPLPDFSGSMGWHPLVERLSYRGQSLDENLVSLGISPYPRVILAPEGDTEMCHAPRVQAALEFTDAPELLRLLKLGAVNRDLAKLAALAAAPLVSEKVPGTDAWKLIKPYTKLFVAVDPDVPCTTPDQVARERAKILDEIKDVLRAQGVERPNPGELDHLQLCMTTKNAPIPPIAAVINDAYHVALRWRYQSYVLTETADPAADQRTKLQAE